MIFTDQYIYDYDYNYDYYNCNSAFREEKQIEEVEMEVLAICKRLQKHIKEKLADSDALDFKSTVNQVDESEAFSFQGPEFSLLQSYVTL
jgi:hypothetical protein